MARILLADDDAATRDLVRRALEADGHKVTVTQDGSEALDRITGGEAFDVLVSDVNMPGLDGLSLAERAANALPGIGVLLMSGFAEQLDKERAAGKLRGPLHGIPILIKDNIGTGDRMHNTAGAAVLRNTRCDRDSFLAKRLWEQGCIFLGKANLSEWANFMADEKPPNGFSANGGQTRNPYGRHSR